MIEDIFYDDSEGIHIDECIKTFTPKECITNEEACSWSIILEGYLSLVVAAVGFFGNAISIWVLFDSSFTDFNDTFNKLLISLAVFDTMFLGKNVNSKHIWEYCFIGFFLMMHATS